MDRHSNPDTISQSLSAFFVGFINMLVWPGAGLAARSHVVGGHLP
jgi:hypothetical protein